MRSWIEIILHKYFRWTALVVVLIVLGVGYSLFISSKVATIQTITAAERQKADTDLADQKALRIALQESLKKYSSIFSDQTIEKINGVLPENAEFPSLLLTLQNVVSSAGYSLDSMTVSPVAIATTSALAAPTQAPGIISQLGSIQNLAAYDLTISVTGPGGYNGFKKLISSFEGSRQLFDVLNVNYTAAVEDTKGGASTSPSLALTVRTYSYHKVATQ